MDRSRTKLVCTIGPASAERIGELVAAGMDVARINFSHGTADDHKAYVHAVRAAAHSARRSVAVMVDLPGPKIRLGELEGGAVTLETGAPFTLRPQSQKDASLGSAVQPDQVDTMSSEPDVDDTTPAPADVAATAPASGDSADAAASPDVADTADTMPSEPDVDDTTPAPADTVDMTPAAPDVADAPAAPPAAKEIADELTVVDDTSPTPDEADDTAGSAMAVSEPTRPPEALGNASGAPVSTSSLAAQLEVGDRVLLADGAAELRVTAISGSDVETEVVHGGTVRSRSGVNIPSSRLTGDGLTDDDRAAIPRALELRADLIAQSFVRSADDVRALRAMLPADGPRVVAKIETRAAVDSFAEIAQVADGIMVARGDLGVDIPFEEVPLVQKNLLNGAASAEKFSIVATQMLESMTGAPRPTRAEASDVANAVLDGADAVMLSAETAIGAYPLEALEAMARICQATERDRGLSHVATADEPASPAKAVVLAAS